MIQALSLQAALHLQSPVLIRTRCEYSVLSSVKSSSMDMSENTLAELYIGILYPALCWCSCENFYQGHSCVAKLTIPSF